MANVDILVTSAGNYQPAMWDVKRQKAMLVLAKLQGFGTYGATNPTLAQLKTVVANAKTAFAGLNGTEPSMLAVKNAIWWKNAELQGGGAAVAVAGVSAATRLNVAKYLVDISMGDLDKLDTYVEGFYLGVLT